MSTIKVVHIATIDASLHSLLLNQMLALQAEGYDVVGMSSAGSFVPLLEAEGIRHIPVEMTRNFTPVADLRSLWQLVQIMRREKFTIVHTHNPKPGLLGQLAARIAGVPVVINTLHGFYFHDHMDAKWRRFYITTEKIAARCSDSILSQNAEDIQTALREKICSPDKISLLGNGIDFSRYDPDEYSREDLQKARSQIGIPPDAPVVGFVGRLAAKRKGFLDFLAAAKRVAEREPSVRFLIVGPSDKGKPDAVDPAAMAEYGIADRCHYLGERPNEELPLLYKLMTVLVLPSLFEGVPRVVMEAAAMKVPAVVTDVKGNREAVERDRNGMLVKLGDVDELAAAILRFVQDPELARRMGEEGYKVAMERFDERRVFEKVKAEYSRLLAQKNISVPVHKAPHAREELQV